MLTFSLAKRNKYMMYTAHRRKNTIESVVTLKI